MLQDILARLSAFGYAPLSPADRFFVGYLAVALVLAILVLRLDPHTGEPRSPRELLASLFPRRVFLHPSALLDYRFVLVNYFVIALLVGFMFLGAATTTGWMVAALDLALGPNRDPATPGLMAGIVFTIVVFMAVDFGNFFAHWLQHKIPWLWEFHKIHHSAEVLTPITALRVHPVGEILSTQVIALCVGAINGGFLYVYQGPAAQVTIAGVNALDFLYYTIGAYHLAHSHVWLMFPRGLRAIFLSPALHLIHHSVAARHRDKNFAFTFTFWDRLFGTLYMPDDSEKDTLVLGLGDGEAHELNSVWQLYWTPFRNLIRRQHELMPWRSAAKPPATNATAIDGIPAE
ncbi:MAG TPA: sterol desaturase family protein [Xanthobacteraceae bacterium]|nr:sterol desaturase family protein [Xanthobacteraceae bacterium]